jgi:hypothetical protein
LPLRDKSSESELKKDRNGRCSATVSPDRTDYSADHGTNRPGDHKASPNTLHLTIFHDDITGIERPAPIALERQAKAAWAERSRLQKPDRRGL